MRFWLILGLLVVAGCGESRAVIEKRKADERAALESQYADARSLLLKEESEERRLRDEFQRNDSERLKLTRLRAWKSKTDSLPAVDNSDTNDLAEIQRRLEILKSNKILADQAADEAERIYRDSPKDDFDDWRQHRDQLARVVAAKEKVERLEAKLAEVK